MASDIKNTEEDVDMAECDGEKVVTMMDVLQEQEDFEEDANAVLGASDDKECTYSKGYIKRQAIYACLTCCSDAKSDPTKRAGVCLACSLTCHEDHELIELYTKRNFRCDCGNPKFNSHPCTFTPNKTELNEENNYNQNFSGIYCTCHRPYPDPTSTVEDEMIQCIICEDWLHGSHLEAQVPANDQYSEMICKGCMEKNEFLHDYSNLAVNTESADVDVINVNGVDENKSNLNKDSKIDTTESTSINGTADVKTTEETTAAIEPSTNSVSETKGTDSVITEVESNDAANKNKEQSETEMENEMKDSTENQKDTEQESQAESENTPNATDQFVDKTESENTVTKTETPEVNTSVVASSKEENDSNPVSSSEENKDIRKPEKQDSEPVESRQNNENNAATNEIDKEAENSENRTDPDEQKVEDSSKQKQDAEKMEEDRLLAEPYENKTVPAEENNANEKKKSGENISENKIETESVNKESSEETRSENELNSDINQSKTCDDKQETPMETISQNDSTDKKSESDTTEVATNGDIANKEVDNTATEHTEKNEESSPEKVSEKRKFEEETDTLEVKKPKLDAVPCIRPKGVKKIYNGATFWPSNFRQKLCTCQECISMYKDLSVLFLIDPEDTVSAYESLGKKKIDGNPTTQYERGLLALSSLGRIQQINALTAYNKMRDELLEFLKSFKDRKEIVKEEDIKAFFADRKPKREPDGVYFCR